MTPLAPSDVDPSRLVLAGDWHGNKTWALAVLDRAAAVDARYILQVGDFGIAADAAGQAYLDALSDRLIRHGQVLWFVDGNHEDFNLLYGLPVDDRGVRPVRPHITHLPRAYRWTWGGRTWLALGGATSLNRPQLTAGVSWWPQEEITDEDAECAIAGGPVDVMVTHDSPQGIDVPGTTGGWDLHASQRAADHRDLLRSVVDAVGPELSLHGHFHSRYDDILPAGGGDRQRDTRITGLDCDGGDATAQAIVLDTATLTYEPLVGAQQLRRVTEAMDTAGVGLYGVDSDNTDPRWRQGFSRGAGRVAILLSVRDRNGRGRLRRQDS